MTDTSADQLDPAIEKEKPPSGFSMTANAAPDPERILGGSDGIRGRTLTNIRWLALFGQTVFLILLMTVFGFSLPLEPLIGLQAAAILFNIIVSFRYEGDRRLPDASATMQLAFDLTHMSGLLFLTGGLTNPFCVLILAPSTVSASILPRRFTRLLVFIAVVGVSGLAFTPYPLPWDGAPPELPPLLIAGVWSALVLTLVFLTAYVARVGREARRRTVALAASQLALEKEQRLSALGAQAAAAAHELGTPLGTLMLILQDRLLAGENTDGLIDDLQLMKDEVARCRGILMQLRNPDLTDEPGHFEVVSLEALLREAAAPHESRGANFAYINMTDEEEVPMVSRRPAVLHALRNVIENAAGYAATRVTISFNFQGDEKDRVMVLIDDDGPGFDAQIARQIGDPYVTSRAPEPGRDGGMGLGLFIAITLLEREGGDLKISKNPGGGARIKIGLATSSV